MTDIGRAGMVMKGDYNSASTYETLDAVSYQNGLYIAKQNVPAGTVPTNTTYWQSAISHITTVGSLTDGISEIYQSSVLKYGNVVEVYVELMRFTATTNTTIAKLPSGFIPSIRRIEHISNVTNAANGASEGTFFEVAINTNGDIVGRLLNTPTDNNTFTALQMLFIIP